VSMALLAMAAAGWGASLWVPRGRPASPELKFNPNILGETWRILDYAYRLRDLRLPLLGISWFWFLGIAYLSQFPNYAKETLGANNQVVTLFLTLFSIGIGAGALLCGKLQRGKVDGRLVPLGALGLAVFGLDFWLAGRHPEADGAFAGAAQFLSRPMNWRIVADLFAIAAAGGLYCVPLYAIMQLRSESAHRARVVAANNIINALFMVLAGIVSVAMLAAGLGIGSIFLMLGVASGVVALVTWRAART
jgi:acyl-[acyl-carrier-protein]-phospholipid O-acyltransferase/long-chain-fatty-acid--[acyl-carrier-protein] ligase